MPSSCDVRYYYRSTAVRDPGRVAGTTTRLESKSELDKHCACADATAQHRCHPCHLSLRSSNIAVNNPLDDDRTISADDTWYNPSYL